MIDIVEYGNKVYLHKCTIECVIIAAHTDDGAFLVAEKIEEGDLSGELFGTERCHLSEVDEVGRLKRVITERDGKLDEYVNRIEECYTLLRQLCEFLGAADRDEVLKFIEGAE